jgi:hypothetical protein
VVDQEKGSYRNRKLALVLFVLSAPSRADDTFSEAKRMVEWESEVIGLTVMTVAARLR